MSHAVYDHPDWRGFVAAIRANPADDVPRLVAADWLEERGRRLRAELIRCHVAWEAGGQGDELRDRINGLFGRCHPRVFRSLKIDRTGTGYKWDRGFVSEVYAPADWWLAHGDAILAREPVREVTLTTWPGHYYSLESQGHHLWVIPEEWYPDGSGAACLTSERPRVVGNLLADRWPGVEFTLPPQPVTDIHLTRGVLLTLPDGYEVIPSG